LSSRCAQYTLGYVSSHTAADGRWRKVEINVRRPGVRGLKLHTRKGYYAPYRKSKQ
jgi:Ca-activated chloride channel family protein